MTTEFYKNEKGNIFVSIEVNNTNDRIKYCRINIDNLSCVTGSCINIALHKDALIHGMSECDLGEWNSAVDKLYKNLRYV